MDHPRDSPKGHLIVYMVNKRERRVRRTDNQCEKNSLVIGLFKIDPSTPRQNCAWKSDPEGGSDGEQLDASLAVFYKALQNAVHNGPGEIRERQLDAHLPD